MNISTNSDLSSTYSERILQWNLGQMGIWHGYLQLQTILLFWMWRKLQQLRVKTTVQVCVSRHSPACHWQTCHWHGGWSSQGSGGGECHHISQHQVHHDSIYKIRHRNYGFSGRPYPHVFWQHNNQEVVFDERVIKLQDNSIVIANFSQEDTGSWMVTAHNNIGNTVRKQIIIFIKEKEFDPIKVSF